jgi:phosphoribosyl-AMP cyclohydrolase
MHDKELEEGSSLAPRFDANGLITAIVADETSGEVLMLAHMNAEALSRTIETREGWFFSRSRKALWKKGETSGNVLRVSEMRIDCDQDAVLLKVRVTGDGKTCHTGRHSCFYRTIALGNANGKLLCD